LIDYLEVHLSMTDNGFSPKGTDWVPNIVAFCCRHCAYAAADLAGGLRLEYPASIKVVELPCTGKFDVLYAMRAFEDGADGVMVAG
jgi:coenzyme F420-reducing hydrogenase delta subunit